MGFLNRILGIQKPVASKMDNLFAMTSAVITLQTALGLTPTNEAALCFKAIESADFESLNRDIQELLKIRANDTEARMDAQSDEYGFQWAVLRTPQFEDLVTTTHVLGSELRDRGYGDRLLAAVFKFQGEGRTVYWVYNYKRGTFYPFVPRGNGQRDNAYELRLQSQIGTELPVEKELERWYAMWGMPV